MSLSTLWGHPAETRKGRLDKKEKLKRTDEQAMGQKKESREARRDRGNMVANQNNLTKQVDSCQARISSWSWAAQNG